MAASRPAGPYLGRYALRVAALAAILLPLIIILLPGNRLSAHSSELRFAEMPLRAGDSATVAYVPSVALAGDDSVVVRARFRQAQDPRIIAREHVRAGVLKRGDDGEFHGRIDVPQGAVYGVLAVESITAERVDANFGRLFDVMVDDGAEGRWSRQQQVNDLLRRNWEMAVNFQRELVTQFPNDPLGWKDLLALEQEIVATAELDSLRSVHTAQLAKLASSFHSRPDLDDRAVADDAAALMWYAILLEDEEGQDDWRDHLLSADPTHPRSVEHRTFTIASEASSDREALDGLEELWREVGPAHQFLPLAGMQAALRLRDAELVERWGNRLVLQRPNLGTWVARQFVALPRLRAEGVRRLIEELEELTAADGRRPLELNRERWLEETAATRSAIHLEIAKALAANDHPDSERQLARALALDWNTDAYREQAKRRVVDGQVVDALKSLAAVAADPGSRLTRDSAAALLGSPVDSAVWAENVRTALRRMADRQLNQSISVPLPRNASLGDEDGEQHELAALLAGRIAVIAYWSPYCGPALEALPEIARLAKNLKTYDAALFLVTSEPRGRHVAETLEDRTSGLVTYYDESRTLTRALEQFGTPAYYVVDSTGNLRFRESPIDRLPRQIAALSATLPNGPGGGDPVGGR